LVTKKIQLYFIIWVSFIWSNKQQENIQIAYHDGAAAPNIFPGTSLPKEGMSEPYMAINSFFELLTVKFLSNRHFLRVIHGHYIELLFFLFSKDQWQMVLSLTSSSTDHVVVASWNMDHQPPLNLFR
jgi:hypothetical protein